MSMLKIAATALTALFGLLAWGSADPSLGLFGPTLNRVERTDPQLAITFDDGPVPEATEAILAALASHDASATFFLLVDRAEAHPALAGAGGVVPRSRCEPGRVDVAPRPHRGRRAGPRRAPTTRVALVRAGIRRVPC